MSQKKVFDEIGFNHKDFIKPRTPIKSKTLNVLTAPKESQNNDITEDLSPINVPKQAHLPPKEIGAEFQNILRNCKI